MLTKRVIPCLDVKDGRVVKGVNFVDLRDAGDPVEQARIYDAERQEQAAQRAADRKSQVGSGDRSERIRTYNFPQGRVTDHRINLTLYKLDKVMTGEALDEIVESLIAEEQAALLTEAQ